VSAQEWQSRARLVLGENGVVDVREVDNGGSLGSSVCVFHFGYVLRSISMEISLWRGRRVGHQFHSQGGLEAAKQAQREDSTSLHCDDGY
jgi:hypothetical protein